ncbi:LRR receptor-like serine/threonine-protein kinase RPK2 [Salvia miltiorrhiza]|uniref:LRR receptor-like serine/threonine-protein kinase RPK2 n=1 Tax=Salvia miltiorrhiza TaxID=226208 RepID=UPI0025AC5F50|nr:LRR receptor-like serine/threonine-protein kinase RPK2 [Salvia miltiorrhiza]XP_057777282.1 LRR receptor-like serine/threonine-protein kinase RPK2 [Salvia miltiorrhiza]
MAGMAEMGKEISLLSAALYLHSFILFLCILSTVSAQFSDERMALLGLKISFSDPHRILDSWNARSSDHCSWFGVSCSSDLRVTRLEIGGNFSRSPPCYIESQSVMHGLGISRNCSDQSAISGTLGGRLSAVIGKFTELRVLSLGFNEIGGEIPAEIWGLRNLQVLDLEGNDFLGRFSSFEFFGLKKLRVLNLAYNRIFGMFPPSLSECRGLRSLNLAGNRIIGVIPGFLGGFRKLRVVNLSFNRLVGYIPSNLGYDCGNLKHLDLSHNFLKGEIPRTLGKCGRLRIILLSSNALHGVIPNELGKLRNLEVLNVARNGLGGPLPANLGNCTRLSVLVLSSHFNALRMKRHPRGRVPRRSSNAALDDHHNSFKGSIPDEITTLPKLKILWAPGAEFNGHFPRNWGSCKSLMMVNLGQNQFTGEIFGLFTRCTNLQYLNLSSNKLTGRLDEYLQLSCKTMLDFSGNRLSGPIPSLNTTICRHRPSIYDPSVVYTSFLVKIAPEAPVMDNDLIHDEAPHLKRKQAPPRNLFVASASGAIAIALILLALLCYKKRGKAEMTRIEIPASTQTEKVILFNDIGVALTYDAIVEATENFNRRNCIGTGGFGKTYRAQVAPERNVAVKRLTAERHQGAAQFHAEVSTLGQIRHPNLITLLGYYACGSEMLLIYNYLPGGNLDRFIRDRARRVFNYATLHKIALHIASALCYLHDQCSPRILHRDIKPSNILLDDESNAYLADFGLSKILAGRETHATTHVAGTYGYIAPEYAMTGRVSDRADVYSYGVVLLELMSEKRALDPSFYLQQDGFGIVSWARMLLDQAQAKEVFAAGLWDAGPHDKLVKMLHVAVLCTVDAVSARPAMRQVVQRLKQIQPCAHRSG